MGNVVIGVAVGSYALKGFFKVRPLLDDDSIFYSIKEVELTDKGGVRTTHKVESVKPYNDLWLVKLSDISTPEDAQLCKGSVITIPDSTLPPLEDDEVYWIHIKGFPVYDMEDKLVGHLSDLIQQTGTSPVFEIEGVDGKTYMISHNPDHVLKIDTDNRKVIINKLGLVD